MNAVRLNRAGHLHEILVDHRNERGVMLGGEFAIHGFEGVNVVRTVVGRQRDAGDQDLDVGIFEACEDGVEIAPRLIERDAAKSVIAAELNDRRVGVKLEDGPQIGDGVFAGGAARALVVHGIGVAVQVEFALQRVRIGLSLRQSIAGGDAVAKANQDGPAGRERRNRNHQHPKRND